MENPRTKWGMFQLAIFDYQRTLWGIAINQPGSHAVIMAPISRTGHTDLRPSSKSRFPVGGFHPSKVMKVNWDHCDENQTNVIFRCQVPYPSFEGRAWYFGTQVFGVVLLPEARDKVKAAFTCSLLLLFTLDGVGDPTKSSRSQE